MKKIFVAFIVVAALAAILAVIRLGTAPLDSEPAQTSVAITTSSAESPVNPRGLATPAPAARSVSPSVAGTFGVAPAGDKLPPMNKAERLAQLRETFRELAKGDAIDAVRAARQISDDTERETALLELVTQWRKGELSNPRERAQAIASYGLEAGLGIELAKDPQLALQWANELTDGPGRAAVVQRVAVAMVDSDPLAAFALSEQLAPDERSRFVEGVFAGWAAKDTEAALQYADQLPDPAQQDAALQAIRSVAPVGIGTQLAVQDGYTVIQKLLPGAAAEQSGQINPGDRILAIAQGDNAFVDARGVPLKDIVDMIRGAPGSSIHLQLLSSDAASDATPRMVSIVRSQIKYKQ